jgi:hypothetical protein
LWKRESTWAGIHAELHNFKGHEPANGLKLFGQVHGAHAPFAYWPNDAIAAEIILTGRRFRPIDGPGSEFVRANGTIESALDQTFGAKSGGITGTQLLSALRAVWHLDLSRRAYFTPIAPSAVTFRPRFLIRPR